MFSNGLPYIGRTFALASRGAGARAGWRVDVFAVLSRAGKDREPEFVALGNGEAAGHSCAGKRNQLL